MNLNIKLYIIIDTWHKIEYYRFRYFGSDLASIIQYFIIIITHKISKIKVLSQFFEVLNSDYASIKDLIFSLY